MRILTRYNTGIVAIILISIAFFILYEPRYPTDVIKSFEINSPELEHKVLIASQLSNYKNAVVVEIIKHLRQRPVFIKVIDVTALAGVSENDWDAIVVIHTWENWAPPPTVNTWFAQGRNLDKIVVITTSGNAQYKMEGINAITSASQMTNVHSDVEQVIARLNIILSKQMTEPTAPGSTETWQPDYPPSFP
jgi:hypothetical protein